MTTENTRNIVSDDLDQAPKTGERYEQRLHDMSEEIYNTMNGAMEIHGDEKTEEWIEKHSHILPFTQIMDYFKSGERSVTLELQREFEEETHASNFTTKIGYALPVDSLDLGAIIARDNTYKNPLKPGEITTLLRFQKTNPEVDSKVKDHLKVEMIQIQGSSILDALESVYVREEKDIDRDSIVL